LFAASPEVLGQRSPHIGYVYPAGGKQGSAWEVTVGGQYLNGVSGAYVSGKGVQAEVVKYTKPLSRKQINELRKKLKELQKRRQAALKRKGAKARGGYRQMADEFKAFSQKMGLKDMDLRAFMELRKKLFDPKRQPNPQLAEIVALRITAAPGAEPG